VARTSFLVDPMQFLVGVERATAIEKVRSYFTDYTGSWFERLAATEQPHRFTEKDFVAVGTLGVEVPPSTAIWLLGGGAAPATALLEQIDTTLTLWDDAADLTPEGPAWQLWDLVRTNGWPSHRGGMGRTTTSKLLAAKRPHLIPIQDSVVTALLFGGGRYRGYWAAWRDRLTAGDGPAVIEAATSIRDEVPAAAHLSVLRILDIVLWRSGR
jgi:hypothetical protein